MAKLTKTALAGILLSIVGNALMIGGLFQTWVRQGGSFFVIDTTGWRFVPNSHYLLILGVACLLASLYCFITNKRAPYFLIAFGVFSVLYLFLLYFTIRVGFADSDIRWSMGSGFWLSVFGALVIVVGAVCALSKRAE
jgi:hypothetical protein